MAGDNPLVGKWFHSFNPNGHTEWQGQILAVPFEGHYLVQTYSWVGGGAYSQEIVPFARTVGWQFYDSNDEMISTYRERLAFRDKEIIRREQEARMSQPPKRSVAA